jgi:PII-like signaling protein
MNLAGKSAVLTIIVGESDTIHGKSFYEEIVKKARALNIAGATVTRGIMGYGGTSRIHTIKVLRLSEDLPVTISIIDSEENIAKLIPFIEENIKDGIVYTTPCDVRIYRYQDKK